MAAALALVSGLCLAVCQWLIYVYAPVEATLGVIQKLFYLHMPLAWWALISFFVVFIASIFFLMRRVPFWDHVAQAAAETGLVFCALALITGMIWGRVSWGIWWTWDPRLTTTLVMWFVYAGYLLVRNAGIAPERMRIISSVIGIAAFLDVPLVFFSARIFRSIHPAVFGQQGGGMDADMLLTLLCCILSLGLFWAALVTIRVKQLKLAFALKRIQLEFLMSENNAGRTE